MNKKLNLINAKNKRENSIAVEQLGGGISSKQEKHRFTAVLPEPIAQRLRIHCARHRLKLKDIFVEAVTEFLDRRKIEITTEN